MSIGTRDRPQLLYWFALFVGASYFVADRADFAGADMTAWKGAGVGLLALWAARHADGAEGWAIATILAAGATGDVLLNTHGLVVGAIAFLVGHVLAILLYARGRWRRWPVVAGAAALTAAAAWALTASLGVAIYAAALGGMAGAASIGRMGRMVAIGAALFVVSDLLLFARMGPLADSVLPNLLVWPTYFGGQALIAWGAVTFLSEDAKR